MANQTTTPALMEGVYAALLTPREADSTEGDASAMLDYIEAIEQAGVNGLVLFGTTGEFVHYDLAERIRLLSLASKRSRIPIVVNVSHSSFSAAIDLAENAVISGAAGVLLMPPYYFHYSQEQILAFCTEFVKYVAGSIPVYLYNIPQFTNGMSAELMQRLLSSGAFAGIKDSSGDWELFERIQAVKSVVAFRNMVGNDLIYSRSRTAGGDGIVSGVAAAVPELLVALEGALITRNAERVQMLDGYLQQFLTRITDFPAPMALKCAANERGWKQDQGAIPLDEASQAALDGFRSWFRQWLPTVLAACSTSMKAAG